MEASIINEQDVEQLSLCLQKHGIEVSRNAQFYIMVEDHKKAN